MHDALRMGDRPWMKAPAYRSRHGHHRSRESEMGFGTGENQPLAKKLVRKRATGGAIATAV